MSMIHNSIQVSSNYFKLGVLFLHCISKGARNGNVVSSFGACLQKANRAMRSQFCT